MDHPEWAFFIVLNSNDIWTTIKKCMYVNKKKSNMDNYKNGDIAAYHGYLELLKNNHNVNITSNAMNWAAERGHLKVIKWLHKNQQGDTFNAISYAAANNQLG